MAGQSVFISYNTAELEEASWVKSVLENNGISCWMAPTSIPGGSSYAAEISGAIRNAKVFVLILSSKAQASKWVTKEVDCAINEGKIILPFMLENCTLKDDFNFYLTNVQRYAAYENKVAAIEKMIREIKAVIDSHTDNENNFSDCSEPAAKSEPQNDVVVNVPKEKKQKKPLKYDKNAILSLVYGIISWVAVFGMFLFPNILACIYSILAVRDLKINKEKSLKMAIAGQVLGNLATVTGLSIWIPGVGTFIALGLAAVSLIIFIVFYIKSKKKEKVCD